MSAPKVGFTEAIVPADGQKTPTTPGDETVPVEWFWLLLRKSKRENYFFRLVLYVIFVALFTMWAQMVRPVSETYTVQSTILAHTAHEAFPDANFEKTFFDVANDPDWWEWLETVLVPAIMSDTYFNGDSRNKPWGTVVDGDSQARTWGNRFMNTISMYNTQTAPVRLRQVRVTDDSCDTPEQNSELARPCWGEFSRKRQYKTAFGETYGNKFLTGLNSISGKEGFGSNYGTEAHVVDLVLDKPLAMERIKQAKQDLWLNEQTRAISVETNWYNANLDLSTYCRWHVDISPGGRYQPYVVIYSCRLDPYSTSLDKVRAGIEVVFVVMLVYYTILELIEFKTMPSKIAYFCSLWNLIEIANLVLYWFIVIWWLLYIMKDKKAYSVVSNQINDDRPNLYILARDFNYASNMAAINIVCGCVKMFKYLQMYPWASQLWNTLSAAMADILPFLVVSGLFTCGFTFAGHWIFGFMMVEFHSWTRSFSTLVQTVTGGLPYDAMKQHSPIGAAVFTMFWILMVVMVLMNMFVAILTEWQAQVSSENEKEADRLARKTGKNSNISFFGGLFRFFYTHFTGKSMGDAAEAMGAKTIYDSDEKMAEINKALKKVDLRFTDSVRRAMLEGKPLTIHEIASHFGGDEAKAADFTRKIRQLMEQNSDAKDDEEDEDLKEKQRLKVLQATVERLEGQLRQLRGALHEALEPETKGTGYEAASQPRLPALPGSIPS